MKNISDVNDLLSLDNNITAKKKSPIIPIITGLAGITILAYAFSIREDFNLSSALLSIGAALFLISIIGIIRKRQALYYAPTGEKVVCKQQFFSLGKKKEVLENLNNKDFGKLRAASSNNDSALMVIIYSTPSESHGIAQILEYIDYQYAPINEPVIK